MRDNTILLLIFIPLLIGALLEVVILGIAFFGADEVDCHWWGCVFTSSDNYTVINTKSNCYHNGQEINCSAMLDINPIINNATGDINGLS